MRPDSSHMIVRRGALKHLFLLLPSVLLLAACSLPFGVPEVVDTDNLLLQPGAYKDLPSWENDDHSAVLEAFVRSCRRLLKKDPASRYGLLDEAGLVEDWVVPCQNAIAISLQGATATTTREYFEYFFVPWQARAGYKTEGLFTGYYEPLLQGSLTPTGRFRFPLHGLPDDLISLDLGEFRDDLRGRRIAGRVIGNRLRPYEDRGEIVAGEWPHNDNVIAWVDNPVDAFFLHIQGSGKIELPDGTMMRVGYAGQNGHPYFAIGRALVHRGIMKKEDVSLQTIRAWLEHHTSEAQAIMNKNKSYVFFRVLEGEGPLGGEGLPLTPQRSLAIDRSLIPYGVPVWLSTEPPIKGQRPFNQIMIAQDTGGAIRGPVRGDVYWGSGAQAEYIAGQMKAKGQYWLLLPKSAALRLDREKQLRKEMQKASGTAQQGAFSDFFSGLF